MSERPGDSGGSFSSRGAAWLAALAIGSLAAAGFLGAFGDALYDPPSFGADGYSRSAVGHRAFAELLRGLGFRVIVSRHRTSEKGADGAVVALLEPRLGPEDDERRAKHVAIEDASDALLVVLPKREPLPDPLRPAFVASAELLPVDAPTRVLARFDGKGKVVRPEGPIGSWRGELPFPTLDRPQLIQSEVLVPLLACDEGILVGEIVGDPEEEDEEGSTAAPWREIVVADPDLLATHGLGKDDNALILVRLLERLGAGERPVVLDETLHGFEQQPSLALELVRFPLVVATLSALFVGALLAWGAMVRFGRPRPPEPALKPGRVALVESSAGLLRHGGHFAHAAAAYLRAAKERVTAAHRALGDGGDDGRWLSGIVEAAGRGAELRAIEERVRRLASRKVGGEEEAVRAAQAIHSWTEEMTDGADRNPRHDRAAQG